MSCVPSQKGVLEQKVEEMRAELLEARTSHATAVSTLEVQVSVWHSTLPVKCGFLLPGGRLTAVFPQISRLNGSLAELQVLLGTKDDSLRSLRESSEAQVRLSTSVPHVSV